MKAWKSFRRKGYRGINKNIRKRIIAFLCGFFLINAILLISTAFSGRSHGNGGLLFMTPRSGGFNNQLITMYEAIHCAARHNRKVVLPLIYENVRADTSSKGKGPFPFEDYFNITEMGKNIALTTPADLDIIGLPCDTIYYGTSKHFKANAARIPRLLKQQYKKRYLANLSFVEDFRHAKRYKCVDDSLCDPPKEFGSYSDYENSGQGYDIRASRSLKNIRMEFHPSNTVKSIASQVMGAIGEKYNAMHIRRGDFNTKCKELPEICDQFGNDSFIQSVKCLREKSNEMNQKLPLFISTTHPEECRELFDSVTEQVYFMEDFPLPPGTEWAAKRTDIIAFASQIVASHAEEFVGNRFSSYTTEINNMRYLRDPKDRRNFF